MDNIPVYKPLLENEELDAAREALELGWLGMGSYVGEFEVSLKEFLRAEDRYVASVSTGYAALHLGLLIAGVGPGDEVITPSFNNIADFQAILATGAEPVFCDIEDSSLCVNLEKAAELVSPRTKAMVVMDYACMLCNHDRVAGFADEYDIRIIHDGAHAFGSTYKGRMVGSFSDICMFSFDPVKNITCIDGGLLVVRSEEELARIQEMRLIGMGQAPAVMYQNQRAWTYDVRRLGFRYHLANLHAAIGLAQLGKIDRITESRRWACRRYNEEFGPIPNVVVPQTNFGGVTPFLYYLRVPEGERDAFREYLMEQGVDTGIHWQPGHWFTLFKNCRRGNLSVTERVGSEIVTLPLHSMMIEGDVERVVDAVTSYFRGANSGDDI